MTLRDASADFNSWALLAPSGEISTTTGATSEGGADARGGGTSVAKALNEIEASLAVEGGGAALDPRNAVLGARLLLRRGGAGEDALRRSCPAQTDDSALYQWVSLFYFQFSIDLINSCRSIVT